MDNEPDIYCEELDALIAEMISEGWLEMVEGEQ